MSDLFTLLDRPKYPIDLRGHLMQPELDPIELGIAIADNDKPRLIEALKEKAALSEPVVIHRTLYGCFYCAAADLEFDGQKLRAASECPLPNGIELSAGVDIPSGRMIVGNDFRPEFDISQEAQERSDHYINRAYGIANYIRSMEAIGALHLFVGNSCPGLYLSNGEFILASAGWNEDEPIEPEGEPVASICTDLWWATIVDGDEFTRRGCEYPYDEVEVEPGRYEFEYYRLLREFNDDDYSKPTVYAKGKLIAEHMAT